MDQDLRTLLTSVRDDAPPPRLSVDDITAAGRSLARARRRLAVLSSVAGGAVAAVAAVTAAFVFTAGPGAPLTPAVDPSHRPNVAASPTEFAAAPAFVTTYRGYTAGQYAVSDPDLVTSSYQQSSIDLGTNMAAPSPASSLTPTPPLSRDRPGVGESGSLVVYRPGAFEPAMFLKSDTKVKMRAGFGSGLLLYSGGAGAPALSPNEKARLDKQMQPNVPTLAWQYEADAWAVIYWSSWQTVPAADTLVSIANGLTPATPREFPVGFRPGNVPPGYQLLSVSYGAEFGYENSVISAVRLSPKPPQTPMVAPYDFESVPSLTMVLSRMDPNPKLRSIQCSDATSCVKPMPDGMTYVSVDLVGLKPPSNSLVAQVTMGIRPENADDMSSWPAAVSVFS